MESLTPNVSKQPSAWDLPELSIKHRLSYRFSSEYPVVCQQFTIRGDSPYSPLGAHCQPRHGIPCPSVVGVVCWCLVNRVMVSRKLIWGPERYLYCLLFSTRLFLDGYLLFIAMALFVDRLYAWDPVLNKSQPQTLRKPQKEHSTTTAEQQRSRTPPHRVRYKGVMGVPGATIPVKPGQFFPRVRGCYKLV
jgi:hypothetical protein